MSAPRPTRSRRLPLAALAVGAALAGLGGFLATQKPPPPPSTHVALRELTPLALPDVTPGEEIVLKGTVRTSFDGTVYDAITRTDLRPDGPLTRRGGLFEPETTGFRVASHDAAKHEVHLIATGTSGEACAAAGVPSPCLLPRVTEAAHERLLTATEFRATLVGELSAELPEAPPAAVPATRAAGAVSGALGLLLAILALVGLVVARRAEPMSAVKRAAARALSEIKGDRAFATLRAKIDALLQHAEGLEQARRTTAARLAKLDLAALEAKARALAAAGAADDVRGWAEKELEEGRKLQRDHEKAVFGLERVVSALGVVALASREERGVRVDDAVKDALAEVEDELVLREQALAEADALTRGPRTGA